MNDVVAKLVSEGALDAEAAQKVREALAAGTPPNDALHAAGTASEENVLRCLAAEFDIPYVDLEKDGPALAPSKQLLAKFPARILMAST